MQEGMITFGCQVSLDEQHIKQVADAKHHIVKIAFLEKTHPAAVITVYSLYKQHYTYKHSIAGVVKEFQVSPLYKVCQGEQDHHQQQTPKKQIKNLFFVICSVCIVDK